MIDDRDTCLLSGVWHTGEQVGLSQTGGWLSDPSEIGGCLLHPRRLEDSHTDSSGRFSYRGGNNARVASVVDAQALR